VSDDVVEIDEPLVIRAKPPRPLVARGTHASDEDKVGGRLGAPHASMADSARGLAPQRGAQERRRGRHPRRSDRSPTSMASPQVAAPQRTRPASASLTSLAPEGGGGAPHAPPAESTVALGDAIKAINELLAIAAEVEIRHLQREIGGYAPPYAGPRDIASGLAFTPEMIARRVRTFAGLAPVLSETLDLIEAATGVEMITGHRLGETERGIGAVSALLPAILSGAGVATRQTVRAVGQAARASRRAVTSGLLLRKLGVLARLEASLPAIRRALRVLEAGRLPAAVDLQRLRDLLLLIKDLYQSLRSALAQAVEQIAAAGRLVTTTRARIGSFIDLGTGRLLVDGQWLRGRVLVTRRMFYFQIDQGREATRQLLALIGVRLDEWVWEESQGVTLSTLGVGTLNSAAARAYEFLSGLIRGSRRGSVLAHGNGAYVIRLKEIIEDAMQNLYGAGVRGLAPAAYGSRLHAELNRLLRRANLRILPRASIVSEVTFARLGRRLRIPRRILDMRVVDYVAGLNLPDAQRRALLRALRQGPGSATRIRDLKPDILVREPGGVLMVIDLTSHAQVEHLAKTAFYRALLAEGDAEAIGLAELYSRALRRRERTGRATPALGARP
jgi:Pre-toxin TG